MKGDRVEGGAVEKRESAVEKCRKGERGRERKEREGESGREWKKME